MQPRIETTRATPPIVARLPESAEPVDVHEAVRLAIDELDQGMMLLSASARLVDCNAAAHALLAGPGPLRLAGGHVVAAADRLQAAWMAGLRDANRGLKRMVLLGEGPGELVLALSAIAVEAPAGHRSLVLAIASRPAGCGELALQAYCRSAGLTPAEERVLARLADGATAEEIATSLGRTLATVRTHIRNILEKTDARSIRALLVRVSRLPPIVPRTGLRIDPRCAAHQPAGRSFTSW
jgi:DNA-binding CsgD family transcriptional regulator